MKEARTPVCENGNGPSSLKHVHEPSHLALPGAWSAGQTIESSSAVRVADMKEAFGVNSGRGASGGRRQIMKLPGSCRNFRGIERTIPLLNRTAELRSAWTGSFDFAQDRLRPVPTWPLPVPV
jgi:hypothetical protein